MIGWPGKGALSRLGPLLRLSRGGVLLLLIVMTGTALLVAHSSESLHGLGHSDSAAVMAAADPTADLQPFSIAQEASSDSAIIGAAGACAILALLCVTTIVVTRLLSARRPVTDQPSPEDSGRTPRPAARRAFSVPFTLLTPLTLGISRV